MAARPEHGTRLIHGRLQRRAYPGSLARDANAIVMRPILLQVGGYRNHDVVVQALSQSLALLLSHPDYLVRPAIHANVLAERVHSRHQVFYDVRADDRHRGPALEVSFVEHAAGLQIHVKDRRHGRRQALYPSVANGLFVIFHMPIQITQRRANVQAVLACLQDRPVILHVEVFALFAFQKVVNIGDGRGDFEDNEHVGAESEDPLGNVPVDAVHEGDYRNHRRHADYDAEQSKRRAQLVCPKRLQRDADGFAYIHGIRPEESIDAPSRSFQSSRAVQFVVILRFPLPGHSERREESASLRWHNQCPSRRRLTTQPSELKTVPQGRSTIAQRFSALGRLHKKSATSQREA